MAPWEILYIYRARLRARLVLVQELLAVLGIAVGVALLFASQVASTSLDGSIRQLTGGIIGNASLQLLARDPRGFDEQLLGRVRGLPGVRGAEPVLEQRATVIGPAGRRAVDLVAGDPRYVHIGGSLLRGFTATQLASLHALALPAPVAQAIGVDSLQTVGLVFGTRRLTALMGAKLDAQNIGALVHSPIAIAPLAYAQEVTGLRGRVTRILVRTAPGREHSVRRELLALAANQPLNVEPADYDAQLFDTAAAPADQSEELFSAISALVGFMFAFNAMLVTAHLRRNLVETLRRRGATRTMTMQVLLFDALVLGVLGTLLGLALGEALSIARVPRESRLSRVRVRDRRTADRDLAERRAGGRRRAPRGVRRRAGSAVRPPGAAPALRAESQCRSRRTAARARAAPRDATASAGGGLPGDHHGDPDRAPAVRGARLRHARRGPPAAAADRLRRDPHRLQVLQRPLYAASTRIAIVELRTPSSRMRSLAIAATGRSRCSAAWRSRAPGATCSAAWTPPRGASTRMPRCG